MKKISDRMNQIIEQISFVLLFLMVIIIFMQVFFRHVLTDSLSWSEELSRFMFIWTTLLGVSVGVKRGFLVAIPFVVDRLKGVSKKFVEIISIILIIIFAVVMIIFGTEMTLNVTQQYSPAMRIPMSYVYASVPVSGVLILLHMYENVVNLFKGN